MRWAATRCLVDGFERPAEDLESYEQNVINDKDEAELDGKA